MAKRRRKQESPGMTWLRMLWDHEGAKMGDSWERINQTMASGLRLAIRAGMEFWPDDLSHMYQEPNRYEQGGFNAGYWIGCSIEEYYRLAVGHSRYGHVPPSPTAIAMIEKHLGREPFIYKTATCVTGIRLAVGEQFYWNLSRRKGTDDYQLVTVTSFAEDQQSLTACTYKPKPDGSRCPKCGHWEQPCAREQIARRVRVTHEALRAQNRLVVQRVQEQKEKSRESDNAA